MELEKNSIHLQVFYTMVTLDKGPVLKPGMFFTIEPMINIGDWKSKDS